jgi:hypothetical protein
MDQGRATDQERESDYPGSHSPTGDGNNTHVKELLN